MVVFCSIYRLDIPGSTISFGRSILNYRVHLFFPYLSRESNKIQFRDTAKMGSMGTLLFCRCRLSSPLFNQPKACPNCRGKPFELSVASFHHLVFCSDRSHTIIKKVYLGAVFCFAGAVCIGISKKGDLSFEAGHILAIGGALTWAIYSIMTNRLSSTPIGMIGLMHVIAVCAFLVLHIVFEQTTNVWNLPLLCWIGVTGLGLAMSLGYSLWHEAMRYGNREALAVVGYYTPLLSTLWLILFGNQQITSWV